MQRRRMAAKDGSMSEREATSIDTHELAERLRDLRSRVDELRGRL